MKYLRVLVGADGRAVLTDEEGRPVGNWAMTLGGQYADALAQMWPVGGTIATDSSGVETADPPDPRTAKEDRVSAWCASADEEERAAMYLQLVALGMDREKAARIKARMWGRKA